MDVSEFEEEIFMKKKAVIIGASSEALHTIRKAKEYGLTVTALDGNAQAEGLKEADEALVVDISDEEATMAAVRAVAADFVLTVPIGRYLTTIGAVNDALGLPGITKEAAVLCTDKFAFHQRLAGEGLRNCRCYAVAADGRIIADGFRRYDLQEKKEMHGEAFCAALELQYPAILKPRFGSGSRGIHMLMESERPEETLEAVKGEEYVLEECVPGDEYGVDGAVIGGEFRFVLLRKKENTPLPARQAVAYYSVQPQDEFYGQVLCYMQKVIKCLGLSECLLHADLIRSCDGPFVIELSARPSGHNLHNLFTPLCTGVDPAEEYIRYRLGLSYSFCPEQTKQMMIHYFDMEGKLRQIPTKEELQNALIPTACRLITYQCHLQQGEFLQPVTDGHSLMGRGYFVIEGESENALRKSAHIVKSLFMQV